MNDLRIYKFLFVACAVAAIAFALLLRQERTRSAAYRDAVRFSEVLREAGAPEDVVTGVTSQPAAYVRGSVSSERLRDEIVGRLEREFGRHQLARMNVSISVEPATQPVP